MAFIFGHFRTRSLQQIRNFKKRADHFVRASRSHHTPARRAYTRSRHCCGGFLYSLAFSISSTVKQTGYEAAFTVWGRRIAYGADPMIIGGYGIETTKPKVFEEAVNFTGAVEGGNAGAMPAAAPMVTQPMDGETVSDSLPEIKANLATLGNVDPKSVTMRISGLGLVPATYDPKTKLVSYKMTQKNHARQVTVIASTTVNTRKSFNIGSNEAPK
jgi:hypothetical protein